MAAIHPVHKVMHVIIMENAHVTLVMVDINVLNVQVDFTRHRVYHTIFVQVLELYFSEKLNY